MFQFGNLEGQIDWALSKIIGVEYYDRGNSIFGQIKSFPSKINLLGTLANQTTKNPAYKAAMSDLANELRAQNTFRNYLAHGRWAGGSIGHGEPAEKFKWQKNGIHPGTLKFFAFNVTVDTINENYEKIRALGSSTQHLVNLIVEERPAEPLPSDDTPPLRPPKEG